MQDVYFVLTVVNHQHEPHFQKFFYESGAEYLLATPAEGTAKFEFLNLLGLEATEKSVIISACTAPVKKRVMRNLVHQMGLDMPNAGIAVSVPMASIGGSSAMRLLLSGQTIEESEEKNMNDAPYSLIVVIANNGCTDLVMDAARSAGAGGGTVLHAKGSGAAAAQKFFGMSIAEEKEIILIASAKKQSGDIMKAIMHECGANSKAHAVCFTLPIDQIAGFNLDIE
ncbi:MAG: P-II family nitrogen regulator [Clostridia bacterium]|nr:P-II family nitrogen regulator [Clostridia bacterium]